MDSNVTLLDPLGVLAAMINHSLKVVSRDSSNKSFLGRFIMPSTDFVGSSLFVCSKFNFIVDFLKVLRKISAG